MRAGVLLVSGAIAVASIAGFVDPRQPRPAADKEVNVYIECPPNGVEFALNPWSVDVPRGDSVSWRLDPRSDVDSMSVVYTRSNWPFRRKPPYKVTRGQARGARDRDEAGRPGKYKYAIQAVCLRQGGAADTLLIDPDMIIIGD